MTVLGLSIQPVTRLPKRPDVTYYRNLAVRVRRYELVLDLDVQGARQLKERISAGLSIFFLAWKMRFVRYWELFVRGTKYQND
jgi:guanylate kinase